MRAYFIRRFLLIPPTLLGITLIVFAITRFVPGGPLERALMEAQMGEQIRPGEAVGAGGGLSQAQRDHLAEFYGFDQPWYVAYAQWMGNVIRGDLGRSTRYQVPVWEIMVEKFPISIYFGVVTLIATYVICIPLGVAKAIHHRTPFDNTTSILVFIGYAIPGYVLGALLLVFLAFRLQWFPTGGFVSEDFVDLSFGAKILDLAHHTALPLLCYLVGSFAVLTFLMKNSLMDHLAADYMRTAAAKGLRFKQAVFGHAFRNSLIPIATNFGNNISIFLTGSFLIERIFNIDGFGLLGYESVVERDYPVVMGILLISAILLLIGNILSDMIVALVDPRIRFR